MKIVIDTNVLVSAVWRDKTPEAVVMWICDQPNWRWIVSKAIKKEYEEVLRRPKFSFSPAVLREWDEVIAENSMEVDADESVDFPRDQKDAKFLACALSCKADYIVTGDGDFDEARKVGDVNIISVSMFKRLFIDS